MRTGRVLDVTCPRTWTGATDRLRLVKLHHKSDEYKAVKKCAITNQWDQGSGKPYVKGQLRVTAIHRVQSLHVWEQYCMRRAVVAAENDGNPGEEMLWHGTTVTDVLVRKGLDPRVCSLEGLFGGGVYFADRSTKSVRYAGCQQPGDRGKLLLCRVALGRQMVQRWPSRGLRRCPEPFPLFLSEMMDWACDCQYHSIFAPAGILLLMNELIVYHTNQGCERRLILEHFS